MNIHYYPFIGSLCLWCFNGPNKSPLANKWGICVYVVRSRNRYVDTTSARALVLTVDPTEETSGPRTATFIYFRQTLQLFIPAAIYGPNAIFKYAWCVYKGFDVSSPLFEWENRVTAGHSGQENTNSTRREWGLCVRVLVYFRKERLGFAWPARCTACRRREVVRAQRGTWTEPAGWHRCVTCRLSVEMKGLLSRHQCTLYKRTLFHFATLDYNLELCGKADHCAAQYLLSQ